MQFYAPIFWEPIPNKISYAGSVLLATDTRHVLKFRKDPFGDVDGIDSKKSTFAKQMQSPLGTLLVVFYDVCAALLAQ